MKTYKNGSGKLVLMLAGALVLPAFFPAGVFALGPEAGPSKKAEIAEAEGIVNKTAKEVKEAKGLLEAKEPKAPKEVKGAKEFKAPKELKGAKELNAPKELKGAKELNAPKEVKEIAEKYVVDGERGGEGEKDLAVEKEAAGQEEIDGEYGADTELDKEAAGEDELYEGMADEKEISGIENEHEDAMESEVDDKGDEVEKSEPSIVEAGDYQF